MLLQFCQFLATLGTMSTSMRVKTAEATLILRAHIASPHREISRQIGINNAVTIEEFHRILNICFGFTELVSNFSQKRGAQLDPRSSLGEHLRRAGDQVSCSVDLWNIDIEVVDTIARDRGTPNALCIGGFGDLQTDFDITAINAELTGEQATEKLLHQVKPEVSSLVERSGIWDFIPLMQAMDFSRHPELESETAMICAILPVEQNPQQRDAFWATVLSMSCMCDEEITDHIIESVVRAIGWDHSATEVRKLCAQSLRQLERIGGMGSPVDRIEIYRELLRL